MIKIVGISGISGSGKTALTHALGNMLNATTVFWDNYDIISEEPKDYIKWFNTSRDYSEWNYDALASVLKQLKSGQKVICPATQNELIPTDYIIFDAPLGRKHPATGQYIDHSIFLNTPLDVALARRVLRDFRDKSNSAIIESLDTYLNVTRPLYTIHYDETEKFDCMLDGNQSVNELAATVVNQLQHNQR